MFKLLDYLNALDTNAVLIQLHRRDPLKAARDFGLSIDEQIVLLKQDRREISAFLDIPFRDFDALDSIVTQFEHEETSKA
ncbi:MAG: hypothetical protein WA071_20295 [Undibacterium umbellatum]|jgi:hypothetical protein|uniref:hypothetical protein n=1 Tax=Undibacterium TaxID=401469 RepID=UPI00272F2049|nr:hypothetical protein [Undibacterium sp.]MDP1976702.1 hypothetical protein [Undibacterium sp.]